MLSTRRQWFTCVRLHRPYLTGSPAFSLPLTTTAVDRSRVRWFGGCPCRPPPKGPPSSLTQHRMLEGFYIRTSFPAFVAHHHRQNDTARLAPHNVASPSAQSTDQAHDARTH